MSGRRADPERDRDIAAAYTAGLSLRACAAKFGAGPDAVRGAVTRAGAALRRAGRPRGLAGAGDLVRERYLGGEGANAIARDLGVTPDAVRRELRLGGTEIRSRPEAAARYAAGVPAGRLAAEYGAGWRTVRAAIARQGVTVTPARSGRPRGGAG